MGLAPKWATTSDLCKENAEVPGDPEAQSGDSYVFSQGRDSRLCLAHREK